MWLTQIQFSQIHDINIDKRLMTILFSISKSLRCLLHANKLVVYAIYFQANLNYLHIKTDARLVNKKWFQQFKSIKK